MSRTGKPASKPVEIALKLSFDAQGSPEVSDMTFVELVQYLADSTRLEVLDGCARKTIGKAREGGHRNPIMGEIIKTMFDASGLVADNDAITREQATLALGPLRLRYMKDDAPVEGFRMVEGVVQAIDAAFNEEAIRGKYAHRGDA